MSETSGFFLSQNGDRKYTPDWLAAYIKALVTTGVYSSELGVTAGAGMNVIVPPGRAWVEGYLYYNDGDLTMPIATADAALGRVDAVVIRLNMNDRTITAKVLPGTYAAAPVAPAITRNADIYELKLAEISVPAGTTAITQSLITDTRLVDSVCGITVSAVQHIPTEDFLAQMEADFTVWFDSIKGILGEDEAGHLLQMIEALEDEVATKITAPTTGSTGQYLQKTASGTAWMTIPTGPTVHTGTTVPAASLGKNGDFYIKTR